MADYTESFLDQIKSVHWVTNDIYAVAGIIVNAGEAFSGLQVPDSSVGNANIFFGDAFAQEIFGTPAGSQSAFSYLSFADHLHLDDINSISKRKTLVDKAASLPVPYILITNQLWANQSFTEFTSQQIGYLFLIGAWLQKNNKNGHLNGTDIQITLSNEPQFTQKIHIPISKNSSQVQHWDKPMPALDGGPFPFTS
jgi:hypothetical protein